MHANNWNPPQQLIYLGYSPTVCINSNDSSHHFTSTFIRKNVTLVSKSTHDLRSSNFSVFDAGKLV